MNQKVKNKIEKIKEAVACLRNQKEITSKVDVNILDEIEKKYKNPQLLSETCQCMAVPEGPVENTGRIGSTICHSFVLVRGKNKFFYELFRELREILARSQHHETLHHRQI